MNQIYLNLHVDPQALIEAIVFSGIERRDILKLIIDLDLLVAEVGFTEELITKLVKSIKTDQEDVKLTFIDWEKV